MWFNPIQNQPMAKIPFGSKMFPVTCLWML